MSAYGLLLSEIKNDKEKKILLRSKMSKIKGRFHGRPLE
jgi:hypothetical protein